MLDACARAKIDPPINFHGLRHTFASALVMNAGASLSVVAKLLGHSSAKMAERYAHLAEDRVAAIVRTLPSLGIETATQGDGTAAEPPQAEGVKATRIAAQCPRARRRPPRRGRGHVRSFG
jgi:Phage integrase family